jgi:hypothetical protein
MDTRDIDKHYIVVVENAISFFSSLYCVWNVTCLSGGGDGVEVELHAEIVMCSSLGLFLLNILLGYW